MDLKLQRKAIVLNNQAGQTEDVDNDIGQSVSPAGQLLSNSVLSLCVHAIFEFEQPIHVNNFKKAINDILLPQNPRFSCILRKDEEGVLRWEKTEVNVDDHVILPAHSPPDHHDDDDQIEYDELVNEYISCLHLNPLPQSRPPWEFHILNYKTSNAAATLIINVHHALGDGISLMSLMFACVRQADNPALLPTFPSSKHFKKSGHRFQSSRGHSLCHHFSKRVLILWYTLTDFITSLLRSKWIDDSSLPFRGLDHGVEFLPKVFSTTTFSLDDIRQIKKSIGGTVNDVITGVIFYGIQRYLRISLSGENNLVAEPNSRSILSKMRKLRVTALALINTRTQSGLQDLGEMMKAGTPTPWGNHFGFLHLPIPVEELENPLDFVRSAKKVLDRKKMSLGVSLTNTVVGYLARLKGTQAAAKFIYNTIANTSLGISNLVGPMEKMTMVGNPVKSFFFFVSGAPHTLSVTIMSYMNSVRVQVIGAKGYIDVDILSRCFAEAFEEIKVEATSIHCSPDHELFNHGD
eukprot:Gb_13458 [translate_table: standard]